MNARGRAERNVWKDTKAVSPVIAVLILVVVAAIGAIAVGAIQTKILRQGEAETEVGDVGVKTLKVIGGPGVAPLMVGVEGAEVAGGETIIEAFEEEHPKVKIDFLRECCGFAMYALSKDVCDLGMGRRFPTAAEADAYPDLKYTVVGKAPLAVIVHENASLVNSSLNVSINNTDGFQATYEELRKIFIDNVSEGNWQPVVYPTEDTEMTAEWLAKGVEAGAKPPGEVYGTSIQGMFSLYLMRGPGAAEWILGGAEDNLALNDAIDAESTNPAELKNYTMKNTQEEVIEFIASNSTPNAIGFVNYVVACDAIDEGKPIVILGLDGITDSVGREDYASVTNVTETDTEAARKKIGRNDEYVNTLGGPMLTPVVFFYKGDLEPVEKELIDFCLMFEGVEIQNAHGFLAGEDIAVAATCPFHTE